MCRVADHGRRGYHRRRVHRCRDDADCLTRCNSSRSCDGVGLDSCHGGSRLSPHPLERSGLHTRRSAHPLIAHPISRPADVRPALRRVQTEDRGSSDSRTPAAAAGFKQFTPAGHLRVLGILDLQPRRRDAVGSYRPCRHFATMPSRSRAQAARNSADPRSSR